MPSPKAIKQRIKSTKRTAQITKAMEVVSATKMRKAQEFALSARPFAVASLEMLENLIKRTPMLVGELPPLLQKREIRNSLLLVVTSDKGLAGAFNANVLKKAEQWIEARRLLKSNFNRDYALITVGKKAKEYFSARGGSASGGERYPILKSFWGFGDYRKLEDTLPVAELVLNKFLDGSFDEVEAVYTNFRTTLLQEAVLKKILPVSEKGIWDMVISILPERGKFATIEGKMQTKSVYQYEYKFEPSPTEILEVLVPQLLRMHIHHLILESNASEHSARMVAMKSASDNAKELITDLTLVYNKARQAGITRELAEITAGREALEQ
jgi:F-type H+-transporting ATPase subunit gamma